MIDLLTCLSQAEVGSRELSDDVLLALPNGDGLDLDEIRRFLNRVLINHDDCWFLDAGHDHAGRARLYARSGKKILAHRAMWALLNGPIPSGKIICHHCDVMGCVNPAHIYCGTHQDNVRDAVERGRTFAAMYPDKARNVARRLGQANTWTRGEGNPKAKLTEAQASAIRNSCERTKILMARFGVSKSTIQKIRRGDHWCAHSSKGGENG